MKTPLLPQPSASPFRCNDNASLAGKVSHLGTLYLRAARVTAVCAAVLLGGCSADGRPGSAADVVEVFTWWRDGGEKEALDALIAVHYDRYPHADVLYPAADDGDTLRKDLADRLAGGHPPDTFQTNIGQDLGRWVRFNGADTRESKVASLDSLAERQGWFEAFPADVIAAASYDGELYGVPIDIHRENALFYNVKLFDDYELTPPTTLKELHAVCASLKEAGVTPLSFGGQDSWTFAILFFENILLATAGAEFYERYFAGAEAPDGPEISEALKEFEVLWGYTRPDVNRVKWDEGVLAVVEDNGAAMTVMGDWAKGLLEAEHHKPGEDFSQIPFPGTAPYYVYTADTFPLTKGAPHPEAAERLLRTFGSKEGQRAFNRIKGSIPARIDIDDDDYDVVARTSIKQFAKAAATGKLLHAVSGIAPSAFVEPVNLALQEYSRDILSTERVVSPDESVVLFALRNYSDLLKP